MLPCVLCARAASLNRHNHAEKQTTNANKQHTKTTATTLSITHHQSPPPPVTTPPITPPSNQRPHQLVDIIVALEPTFGGVNLEDVRSPECFYVERECQRRMAIPVFHDDQHGTAIVAGAGEAGVGRGVARGRGV